MRSLVIVLGDQLDLTAAAFDGFDSGCDAVWMAEVAEESTHVWSSKQRIALFLSAMRHFALELRAAGCVVHYTRLECVGLHGNAVTSRSLAAELQAAIERLRPQRVLLTAPGDWRVLQGIKETAVACAVPLEIREDRHFYCTVREFAVFAKSNKRLRLEYFYRNLRRKHRVLMQGDAPIGGRWNFDADNRESFGPGGPGQIARVRFEPDAMTKDVIDLVNARFATHPGSLSSFAWPVTREQSLDALRNFVAQRLPAFGRFQDAMWTGESWGHHSQLAAALNLKLLNPREVVSAAQIAYEAGAVPLPSAEGFIRQILGWREYVRGVYWTKMPQYLELNALQATAELPPWYWTADTDMACLRDVISQTLQQGYAHHIQRLMVTGLYALLLGVRPRLVHEWYLAVYVDAVEWVELPNTLGMSQYADAGYMASKPYIASGNYINRMSNFCAGCRYSPGERVGPTACPFTTLYWDFLIRHDALLAGNPRMGWQLRNARKLGAIEKTAIGERAAAIRRGEIGPARHG